MHRKPIEKVGSGEQIVRADGSWDRVHGVSDPVNGKVTVNTDSNRFGEYPVGTIVDVA